MAVDMIVFDYRDTEKAFFANNNLENFNITFYSESLNEETVKNIPQEIRDNAYVISVFINSEITEEVINYFKNLRIIATRSTGVDHINKKACLEKNISVVNVENYGATSVAQYTFGLILALERNILPALKYVEDGKFQCTTYVGRDLSKLTIGIVGTGAIGAAVCKIANSFGMNILAYDLQEKSELTAKYDIKYSSFDDLIRNSDIITLHLPFTGNNKHMLSKKEFELMKENAFVINTARGEIINTFDLYDAIVSKKIKGAGLDVVACEDVSFRCSNYSKKMGLECQKEAEIVKKLVKLPNVIVTPHIAYETQDAIEYILSKSFEGIIDSIKGGNSYKVI